MEPERLLAKSRKGKTGQPPTIAWHTKCVLDCADHILGLRCGDAIAAMGLPQSAAAVLERIVRFAAWLHDIGKCASTFQEALEENIGQPFRHEVISWYITTQVLDGFLANYVPDKTERWMIAACVAGHHRKYDIRDGLINDYLGECELYLQHGDFCTWIKLIPTDQAIGELPAFGNRNLSSKCLYNAILKTAIDFDDQLFPVLDDERRKTISLAKSFLMASDISASALSEHSIGFDWIDKKLGTRAGSDALKAFLEKKLEGNPLREFQEQVAQSQVPWTFLKAGCGTGKTVAACEWAIRNHSDRQLWLTYPTTGTATQGFKDYVMGAQLESSLLHSRALWDLEELGKKIEKDSSGLEEGTNTKEEEDANDLPERGIALRGWGADTVVATVDTVLGIVQNHKTGHYAYPGILKGALVFDEIHAYDRCLFASLLRFLETHPNIPCLLMTASLQEGREQALKELHYKLFQNELITIGGPEDLETMPRYIHSKDDPWTAVEQCRQDGGKVLWVSNTVDRCIEVGREAVKNRMAPLFYHSRYKYSDRVKRHKDIMDAFKNKDDGFVFASTTQVAEMSLDISADLLITDIASIPAMIQRLGRLNRRTDSVTPPRPLPFVAYKQPMHQPYTQEAIERAEEWLGRLPDEISQRDLADCWLPETEEQNSVHSNWLDEPLWTRKSSLREASPSISVVLESDLECIIKKGGKPISYYQIDMPPRKTAGMGTFKGRLVATDKHIRYNDLEGASWLKQ